MTLDSCEYGGTWLTLGLLVQVPKPHCMVVGGGRKDPWGCGRDCQFVDRTTMAYEVEFHFSSDYVENRNVGAAIVRLIPTRNTNQWLVCAGVVAPAQTVQVQTLEFIVKPADDLRLLVLLQIRRQSAYYGETIAGDGKNRLKVGEGKGEELYVVQFE